MFTAGFGGDIIAANWNHVKDVDDNGSLDLYLPYSKSDSNARHYFPDSKKLYIKDIASKKGSNVQLAWINEFKIGVKKSNWEIWDLKSGTRRSADNSELSDLKKKSSQDQLRIIQKKPGDLSFTMEYDANTILRTSYLPERISNDNENIEIPKQELSISFESKAKKDSISGVTISPFQTGPDFSKESSFSHSFSISPTNDKIVFSNHDGTILYLVDLKNMTYLGRVVQSSSDPNIITTVLNNGYYLSGNGKADDVVFSDGLNGYNLSQFEVIYNRPDITLEKLGAETSVIEQARKLRARHASRSDFKSLEKSSLIDVPVVAFKGDPPQTCSDKSLQVSYQAENNTGPLKELKIYNNGALVSTKQLRAADGAPSMDSSGNEIIQLAAGDNLIQLCAINENGVSSTFATAKVNCTAPPVSKQCFIATVGISQYKDTNYTLQYAAKDAGDMAQALSDAASKRGLDPKVLVIKNDEVTASLTDKIRSFLSQASVDDEVVLYFAGHGLLDKDLGYHYPIYETDFNSTESNGIPFNELESLVENIKPLKRTIFFDTCHSGEVEDDKKAQLQAEVLKAQESSSSSLEEKGVTVHGIATRGMRLAAISQPLPDNDFVELEKLFPDSRRAKGANLLTSSSGSEFSMESDEWKNGLFTYCFLRALKDAQTDKNRDGKITFNEVADAVKERVSKLSGGKQRPITRGVNREVETVLAINNDTPLQKPYDNAPNDTKTPPPGGTQQTVPTNSQPARSDEKDSTSAIQGSLDQANKDLATSQGSAIKISILNRGEAKANTELIPIEVYRNSLTSSIINQWKTYYDQRKGLLNSGIVVIAFKVTQSGAAKEPHVVQSDGNSYFDDYSLRSITGATLPSIPPDMANYMKNGHIEIECTFKIEKSD